MPSTMSLVIHRTAMGTNETRRRKTTPKATTVGPDCQTIRRTGGTLRNAERRSRQLLQKLSRSAICPPRGYL